MFGLGTTLTFKKNSEDSVMQQKIEANSGNKALWSEYKSMYIRILKRMTGTSYCVSYWNNHERRVNNTYTCSLVMTQVTIGIMCYLGLLMHWLLEKPIENSVWSSKHKISSSQLCPLQLSLLIGLQSIHGCASGQPTIPPLNSARWNLTAKFSSTISRWFKL